MPKALDILATVTGGTLPIHARQQIKAYLPLFDGRDVRVRISSPKRSSRANSYYWVAIIDRIRKELNDAGYAWIQGESGNEPVTSAVLHEYFKARYLSPRTAVIMGRDVTLAPTTTTLDSTAFHDYIEAIKMDEYVLALGIDFEPVPDMRSYAIAE